MSTNSITIKANNHRIHPVSPAKKAQLVSFLLEQNPELSILLCVSEKSLLPQELQELQENQNFTLLLDSELETITEKSYAFVISYDLPLDSQLYIQRVSKASQKAVLLLDTNEQNKLYPLETLLGRTIKQEPIEGFTEESKVVPKKEYKAKEETRTSAAPKKYNKDKKQNKYLGKDENGKAIFSGKSGERNHRYDGTPKDKSTKLTGKTINVKAKKKD